MIAPEPPPGLDDIGIAAWLAALRSGFLYFDAAGRGSLADAVALHALAMACSLHVRVVRELRTYNPAEISARLRRQLDVPRQHALKAMALLGLPFTGRGPRCDGIDADLGELIGLPVEH